MWWQRRGAAVKRPTTRHDLPAAKGKPHIALVAHSAGEYLAGAERSLLSILAAIDRKKYGISCILPCENGDYQRIISNYTDRIFIFPYQWWTKAKPFDEGAVSQFEAIFERESIDIVHVNTIALMDPLVAARRHGVPNIVHAREIINQDGQMADQFGDHPSAIVHRIKIAADFIIANSEATHRLYRKKGRSFRLYNCIDVDAFEMPNEVVSGHLKVGIISTNTPKKGIEYFVKLAVLAGQRQMPIEFIAFGPRNEYTDGLEHSAQSEGIPINLCFSGYVADPVEAVRKVNVIASFSTFAESFGRTLVEGMAARRPIIAFDLGAVREIVRHGVDGFVVPAFDIERALTFLETLANEPARITSMGNAGRKRAEKLFAPAQFSLSLNEIYRRILETYKSPEQ